jgi:hypothetical protein
MSILALAIPVVAIVMGIGVAFWAIYWDHQKRRLEYEERRLMIEKGMVPPVLANERPLTPDDHLRRGVIMTFLGVGLWMGSFWLSDARAAPGPPAWLLTVASSIVGLLGVGNLAYYLIARRRTTEPAGER